MKLVINTPMNGNNPTDPKGQNEVSIDKEIREIVQYIRTIDVVQTAEYPVMNEKYSSWKQKIADDPKCIQDTVEEVDRRLVACYVCDIEAFHSRMKDRFEHERSASLRQAEDLQPARPDIEGVVLIRICQTRQENGFDPIVRMSELTEDDFDQEGLVVPDSLVEEAVDMGFQYIDPVMPEELDEENRLSE